MFDKDCLDFLYSMQQFSYETKTKVVALLSDVKTWRKLKLKLNESKTDHADKGNLRTNVTQEFSNLDIEASTLAPVKTAQNLGISSDPELSSRKQIRHNC